MKVSPAPMVLKPHDSMLANRLWSLGRPRTDHARRRDASAIWLLQPPRAIPDFHNLLHPISPAATQNAVATSARWR
jgi:hypothetical protein